MKAIFDGEKIVLPPHVRPLGRVAIPVAVTIEFPSGILEDATGPIASTTSNAWQPRSVWDIIDDDYQPKRSLEDALAELEEGRAS